MELHPDDALLAQALEKTPAKTWNRTRAWLERDNHSLIGLDHPDYPPLLRRSPSPPRWLFVDGDAGVLWHPSIAIVGTRLPTPDGRDNAREFAAAFARGGLSVTSGLAAGIDAAAHIGALDASGLTVAVLGTGIDVPFPPGNKRLMERIAQEGVVVSEYPPGTIGQTFTFPHRNRIVAGLSLGTLVIEAAYRSGALITARLAADAGREVFATPGSIRNPMARGCHRLLRQGVTLVETPEETLEALAPVAAAFADDLRARLHVPTSSPIAVQHRLPDMDVDTQCLWEAIGHDPTPMETIVTRTGLTAAKVASILLSMELGGRVVSEHGRYTRKSS
jgi:DNA processing protein